MKKIDLKKELKLLYAPSAKEAELVKVPKFNFLMIDGKGDPNGSKEFQNAVQALYAVSYTLKFKFKFEKGVDYPVMALEGLWWMSDGKAFDMTRRPDWNWTLMVMQPNVTTKAMAKAATKEVKEKKALDSLDAIRFEPFAEGPSIQIMHVGPYSKESATIQTLYDYAKERGFELCGKHHEIYFGDPRRTKPEKLKTILRQPVKIAKK